MKKKLITGRSLHSLNFLGSTCFFRLSIGLVSILSQDEGRCRKWRFQLSPWEMVLSGLDSTSKREGDASDVLAKLATTKGFRSAFSPYARLKRLLVFGRASWYFVLTVCDCGLIDKSASFTLLQQHPPTSQIRKRSNKRSLLDRKSFLMRNMRILLVWWDMGAVRSNFTSMPFAVLSVKSALNFSSPKNSYFHTHTEIYKASNHIIILRK